MEVHVGVGSFVNEYWPYLKYHAPPAITNVAHITVRPDYNRRTAGAAAV